jgi:hypothetical protein
MANSFFADMRELQRFIKDLNSLFPSTQRRIIKDVLNDQAFEARREYREKELPNNLTLRTSFAQRTIQVKKAVTSRDVRNISAVMGSRIVGGWRGLSEIESGDVVNWNPATVSGARGGSDKKTHRPSLRYSRLGEIKSNQEYPGSSVKLKTIAMLRSLDRQNWKGAFFITDHPTITDGLYKFSSQKMKSKDKSRKGKKGSAKSIQIRKIIMIRSFEKDNVKLEKRPMMKSAINRVITPGFTARAYQKHVHYFASKYKPK